MRQTSPVFPELTVLCMSLLHELLPVCVLPEGRLIANIGVLELKRNL